MRILIVCPKLSHGGAERVGVCLANGLSLNGHEVVVASNLYEDVTYELNEQVQVFNLVGKSKKASLKWLSAIRNLRNHIKTNKPDVIIGIMQLCSFVAKVAQIGMHIPVIMTEHDSFEKPDTAPFTKSQYFFKYYLNKIYTHVTVLTNADKILANKTLKKVTVMPNPLALQPILTETVNRKIIMAAGRLDAWHYKGFDVLIKSFGLIMKDETINIKDSGWRLQIAGVGSEESLAYLKQLSKENGVEDSVDFLGYRTDIQELFKQAEIFVLSSRYEGFGLVLIEAMSQGCACVACDYKGRQKEIFDGEENGVLCEPDNVESLANAVYQLMVDQTKRKRIQQKAIKRADFYSINDTIKRWNSLLDTVVHDN